ncbi:MAG: hypothetical protein Ta2D_13530 [Rickettsiales bacterium]|nr:MAG: hypothetical protein Ta2D_13530 [Rickettsiales bacterium]
MIYEFPFGEKIKKVEQNDKTSKKVFVLGAYASAVHAEVRNTSGKILCKALAVASEPEIFWKGNILQATNIIKSIKSNPYTLTPATLNGESGKCLDLHYLNPLDYERKDAWLCDLIPYSRINQGQKNAIERLGLTTTIPNAPASNADYKKQMTDITSTKTYNYRIDEIKKELFDSGAKDIILLGDYPLQLFLLEVCPIFPVKNVRDIITKYGIPIKTTINKKEFNVYIFCHPHHIEYKNNYGKIHKDWIRSI